MEGACNQCAFPVQDPKSAEYSTGATPLMHAVWKGYLQCVKELIAAEADVNQADDDGDTPLMWAVMGGQTECLLELLESGADVNLMNNNGKTAIMYHYALRYPTCILELIKAGADVNSVDDRGCTLVAFAVKRGDSSLLQQLIEFGADVNMLTEKGLAPLMYAPIKRNTDCLDILLAAGADVNVTDDRGSSALIISTSLRDSEAFVKKLLEAGTDVNHATKFGDTALIRAAGVGNVTSIKYLLKANAQINRKNVKCKNALKTYLLRTRPILRRYAPYAREDISLILFAAGEKYDDEDIEMVPDILKEICDQFQLKHVCREAIRKHLLDLDPHQHLFGRIPKLGLPSALVQYLLYNMSLDNDDDHDVDDYYKTK